MFQISQKLLNLFNKEGLKQSTQNTGIRKIKRFFKECLNSDTYDPNLLTDFENVKHLLTSHFSINEINATINMLNKIIRAEFSDNVTLLNLYNNYSNEIHDSSFKNASYQKISQKDAQKWISTKELSKIYKKYETKLKHIIPLLTWDSSHHDKRLFMQFVFLTLYTQLPPLRPSEYMSSLVYITIGSELDNYEKLKNFNIFDLSAKSFYIYKQKSDKKHKMRILPLPDNVVNILRKFVDIFAENDKLFCPLCVSQDNKSTTMGKNTIYKLFNDIFKNEGYECNIGFGIFRKVVASEFVGTIPERAKLAESMNHTLLEHETIYNKYNNINNVNFITNPSKSRKIIIITKKSH